MRPTGEGTLGADQRDTIIEAKVFRYSAMKGDRVDRSSMAREIRSKETSLAAIKLCLFQIVVLGEIPGTEQQGP